MFLIQGFCFHNQAQDTVGSQTSSSKVNGGRDAWGGGIVKKREQMWAAPGSVSVFGMGGAGAGWGGGALRTE